MIKKVLLPTIILICMFSLTALGFSDVSEENWFYRNVTDMAEQGYLTGYEDGSFRPDGIITQAEFVTVVARVAQLAPSTASGSHWAAPMLASALSHGYYDWDEIPPTGESFDAPISRQLAFKIVMNAFLPQKTGVYEDIAHAPDFTDLDGRYYQSVSAAVSQGVVLGDENGYLHPKGNLIRAEACAIIMRAAGKQGLVRPLPITTEAPASTAPAAARKGGVGENGPLQVIGTQLCNQNGEPVVLHGMSSHGIQWFSQFVTEDAIRATADRGANLFRIAMYTGEGGYLTNPALKNTLLAAADAAIRQDMYVIIDWHILSDGDPLQNADAAEAFFREISARYKDSPAVLYEICNEPNGSITWSGNVKPYAERIIKAIRENSDGIILVGSPTWSQDLHEVAKDPLAGNNIMYSCHFYAGTHTDWLRQRIADCNLPVFVTEWGCSAADGNGGVYLAEAQKWIDFMRARNISWANWSYCDKGESSAALRSGANPSDGISDTELTESGAFVFRNFE